MEWAFRTSKPAPSDTPTPIRPHLVILPIQFCQLQIKHSGIWLRGDIFIQVTKKSKEMKYMEMDTEDHINSKINPLKLNLTNVTCGLTYHLSQLCTAVTYRG